MNILIFSGTTEGRRLSHTLAQEGAEVTVSVATPYGEEEQGSAEHIRVLCGRMDEAQMAQAMQNAEVCIDATHPYAVLATETIRHACEATGTPYLRLLREKSAEEQDVLYFKSAEQAAQWLKDRPGNIMLTTGAKELATYAAAGAERLYPRVLPLHSGIDACEQAGIPHRNILAMQGPFSTEVNAALLRQYDIRYLVTKDGGTTGGFLEKIQAARQVGVTALVLERPQESGYSYADMLEQCRERITCR